MRKRSFRIAMIGVVCLGLAVSGCETAGQSAGAGAITGGIIGGIIGNQSGHAGEGALIGAAIGGLAGYAIHKARSRQVASAQDTYNEYDYQPDQGFKLDMRDASVSPGQVAPGGTVTTSMKYATLGAPEGVKVTEQRVLRRGDSKVTTLQDDKVERTDGVWENELEFEVPKNADSGQYTIAQTVSAQGQSYGNYVTFDIAKESASADGETYYRVVSMNVSEFEPIK